MPSSGRDLMASTRHSWYRMRENGARRTLLPGLCALAAVAFLMISYIYADAPSASREQTIDGLVRLENSRVDVAYVAPGMTLAPYSKVMLDPPDVAFKRDWRSRHPEITGEDAVRLRAELSASFHDVFAGELQKGGYALVYQPGPDVLMVRASIIDLDIAAPDRRGVPGPQPTTYVISSGEMTLLAELRDSQSGALLARVADRKKGRESPELRVANAITNATEARNAFTHWATLLRDRLNDAKTVAQASP